MLAEKKSFDDFVKDGKKLFSEDDLKKCLIMDDQVGAIADLDSIILSKKFLQFSDYSITHMSKHNPAQLRD